MIQEHGGYLLACDNCVRGNQASWSYEFNVCVNNGCADLTPPAF